jgi:ABC-2 type transport system ATP-binding protein
MEALEQRYHEVMVLSPQLPAARALKPIQEREFFGRSVLLFDGVDRQQLLPLGDVRTPGIADLLVALVGNKIGSQATANPDFRGARA